MGEVTGDLLDCIELHARARGAQPALSFGAKELSWSALQHEAQGALRFLERNHVRPGARLALLGPDPIQYLVHLVAAMRMGVGLFSSPQASPPAERARILTVYAPDAELQFDPSQGEPVHIGWRTPRAASGEPGVTLHYVSSGSTGTPKILPRSGRSLMDEARAVSSALPLCGRAAFVNTSPVTHSFTGGLALGALVSGAKSVFLEGIKPKTALDACRREEGAVLSGVPYLFTLLSRDAGREEDGGVQALCGGAPVSADLAAKHLRRFRVPIVQEYGLSEVGIVSMNIAAARDKPTSIGRPLPGLCWELASAGGEGELRVGTGRPADVASDWVDTGDIARFDEDGAAYIVGRRKTMVNVSGNKVFPEEIVQELGGVADVEELQAAGIPDPNTGERVVLFVQIAPGNHGEIARIKKQLMAKAQDSLARHKWPSQIAVTDLFPRLANGKVDLARLRRSVDGGEHERRQAG